MTRGQKSKPTLPAVALTAAEIEAEIREAAAQLRSQHMRAWHTRLMALSRCFCGQHLPDPPERKQLNKNQIPKSKPRRCQ
jgi:hypothetical protein